METRGVFNPNSDFTTVDGISFQEVEFVYDDESGRNPYDEVLL
jgi:PDZ domain-containing secreted protein